MNDEPGQLARLYLTDVQSNAVLDRDFAETLVNIHEQITERLPSLARVAVAIYDPETDVLKTFADSTGGASPISFHHAKLEDVPSLKTVMEAGKARIINDMRAYSHTKTKHTQGLLEGGFLSSMTVPLMSQDELFGFLFFNAREVDYFTEGKILHLHLYIQVISLLLLSHFRTIKVLHGALATAREFSRYRDEETSMHLARMSRYARLIAFELRDSHGLTQEFIETIFQFTPLHDVGKIGVRDEILLKKGKLSPEETAEMREHVSKGSEIIDLMVEKFGLSAMPHIEILRNVIRHHHECWDGMGYPDGLAGEEIPLEARITTVADVFDALTSSRPYKPAWSYDEAAAFLKDNRGIRFDEDCVDALLRAREQIEEIQAQFSEDPFG